MTTARNVGEVREEDGYQVANTEWIPCMRTSFLTGISTGVGAGLFRFLFTSDARKSYRFSLYVYLAVTLGRYSHCRWQKAKDKFEGQKFKAAVRKFREVAGTDQDPRLIKQKQKEKLESQGIESENK